MDDGPRTVGGVTPGSALEADDATRREGIGSRGSRRGVWGCCSCSGCRPISGAVARRTSRGETRRWWRRECRTCRSTRRRIRPRATLRRARGRGVVGAEKLRAVVPLEIGVSPRRVEARPPGPRPVSYTVTSQPPERGEMRRSGRRRRRRRRRRAPAGPGRAEDIETERRLSRDEGGPGRARWDGGRVARRIPRRPRVVERGRASAPEVTPAKTRRVASIARAVRARVVKNTTNRHVDVVVGAHSVDDLGFSRLVRSRHLSRSPRRHRVTVPDADRASERAPRLSFALSTRRTPRASPSRAPARVRPPRAVEPKRSPGCRFLGRRIARRARRCPLVPRLDAGHHDERPGRAHADGGR